MFSRGFEGLTPYRPPGRDRSLLLSAAELAFLAAFGAPREGTA